MPFKPARREPDHPAGPASFVMPTRFSGVPFIYPPVAEAAYYLMPSHAYVSQHPDVSEGIWDTMAKIKKNHGFKTLLIRSTPHIGGR
jgi:hypothetical protein